MTDGARIAGFSQDDELHWRVHLDCGHRVHARHDPPWQSRPWVVSAARRRAMLGTPWRCPYCGGDATMTPAPAPLELVTLDVDDAWIDYNGHMNLAYYVLAFDRAVDALLAAIGIDAGYVDDRRLSTFSAEIHVCYLAELRAGDPLRITGQVLDADAKRLHFFLRMFHAVDGYLAATLEQVALHVDLATRRTAAFPDDVLARINGLRSGHAALDRPGQAGRVMGLGAPRDR